MTGDAVEFARGIAGSVRASLRRPLRKRGAGRGVVRQVTGGASHHWFGYYDKPQWSADERHLLANAVSFAHRAPTARDAITVGCIDLGDGDGWTPLGSSTAWSWQQGCMLQWLPGSRRRVAWNDRDGSGGYLARVLDLDSGERTAWPWAIEAVSGDGSFALVTDFERLAWLRPGYGYAPTGGADRHPCPSTSGLWRVDTDTGERALVLSVEAAARLPAPATRIGRGQAPPGSVHFLQHVLLNPSSTRVAVLHRWRRVGPAGRPGRYGFGTRMITCAPDGSDARVIDDSGSTSHFTWRDDAHVCAWSTDTSGRPALVVLADADVDPKAVAADVPGDGHFTYVPGTSGSLLLGDTYPTHVRRQSPYLLHVPSGSLHWLAHLRAPVRYSGASRCDTHPTASPTGRFVAVDSAHTGERQVFVIDASAIVDLYRSVDQTMSA